MSGTFANVAGHRVPVANSPSASFQVLYTPTSVILTNSFPPAASAPPRITSVGLAGGTFTLSGTGGPTGGGYQYYVYRSLNVEAPLNIWTPVATNLFATDGSFSVGIPVSPSDPRQFYVIKLP